MPQRLLMLAGLLFIGLLLGVGLRLVVGPPERRNSSGPVPPKENKTEPPSTEVKNPGDSAKTGESSDPKDPRGFERAWFTALPLRDQGTDPAVGLRGRPAARHEGDEEQHQEDHEEDLGDPGRRAGNAAKSEDCGDQCDD